jgi:SAM-dependent methyltransferase
MTRRRRYSLKKTGITGKLIFTLAFIFIQVVAYSQNHDVKPAYVPRIGQPGKDVIWLPTPPELVNKMLEIADVSEKDYVIDLGSGDGRTVIAAAKLGAQAVGIEYNPDLVELSKEKAKEAGVSDKTKFIQADFFESDLSKATVITMFLLPEINLKLRPRLLQLKPGTRIVSNTFTMGDWNPDYEAVSEGKWGNWYSALMWIIPAKVAGVWKLGEDTLKLRQEFQMVYGTLKKGGKTSIISEGRLNGEIISFSVVGATYSGRVSGKNLLTGTVITDTGKKNWKATREDSDNTN